MDVIELIDRYCLVWNEPDPSVREQILAPIWAEGASYTDPSVHAANATELLAHIASVRARRPGASVIRTSAIDLHHAVARFAWHVVQADGAALPEGLDIAFISADGSRIEKILGFFGPLPRDIPA